MKKLSEENKKSVIFSKKPGVSYRDISLATGISLSQVYKILKENAMSTTCIRNGRRKKLSLRKEMIIVRKFKCKEFMFASDAKKWIYSNFSIKVSGETIRKTIKKHGLMCFKKQKKPFLNNKHIKNRFNFAKNLKNYTYTDFQKILYSDESKFNLSGSDGFSKVWCCKDVRHLQSNIHRMKKFGGGNVMVWGIITSQGVGKILRVSNSMNSAEYCDVLKNGFIETIRMHNLSLSDVLFMQDNAACHTSKMTREWLRINNIALADHPACSPDLNPIEHVWSYIEKKLRLRSLSYNSSDNLWSVIEEEWYKIPQDYIDKLYWSMCERIKEVIRLKGNITRY